MNNVLTSNTDKKYCHYRGTRRIGYGMADKFLKRGFQVTTCGRSQRSVDKAVQAPGDHHNPAQITGQPCDVRM